MAAATDLSSWGTSFVCSRTHSGDIVGPGTGGVRSKTIGGRGPRLGRAADFGAGGTKAWREEALGGSPAGGLFGRLGGATFQRLNGGGSEGAGPQGATPKLPLSGRGGALDMGLNSGHNFPGRRVRRGPCVHERRGDHDGWRHEAAGL